MHIYMITNKINGKFYIGKTVCVNAEQRWKRHVSSLKHAVKSGNKLTYLQNAMKKYGSENFVFEVIESLDNNDKKMLSEREIWWIANKHPEYNMTKGGEGMLGCNAPKSQQHREKISSVRKGGFWCYNPETLEETYVLPGGNVNDGWIKGRSPKTKHGGSRGVYDSSRSKYLIEWNKNNPNPMLGKKHSEETKQKIREGRYRSLAAKTTS